MKLAIAVQHHPSRARLIPKLRRRLGVCEVVFDPDPASPHRSALRTYVECLRSFPEDATHLLVIQDDAWPCRRFRTRAKAFVAEHEEHLCALFVPNTGLIGRVMRRAVANGETSCELPPRTWAPTVALVWPRDAAESFLAFVDERYDVGRQRSDDGPVGAWRRRSRARVFAPVPSLVQHPDVVPSLMGRATAAHGRNRARVAVAYAD